MVYKRKYKVNKNELKKYFQDLTELEDWIPYKIRMELPKGYSLKLGKNATNKDLLSKRSVMMFLDPIDTIFAFKYPGRCEVLEKILCFR